MVRGPGFASLYSLYSFHVSKTKKKKKKIKSRGKVHFQELQVAVMTPNLKIYTILFHIHRKRNLECLQYGNSLSSLQQQFPLKFRSTRIKQQALGQTSYCLLMRLNTDTIQNILLIQNLQAPFQLKMKGSIALSFKFQFQNDQC